MTLQGLLLKGTLWEAAKCRVFNDCYESDLVYHRTMDEWLMGILMLTKLRNTFYSWVLSFYPVKNQY